MEAKKLKDPTTKYYFNKIMGDELFELLAVAVENSAEVLAWLKGQEKDVQIYYPTRLDKAQEKLYLEYQPALLMPKESNFIKHFIFLKMNLGKFYIFGHGKLFFEDGQYFLKTSSIFYKSQQRENLRVEAAPDLKIKMVLKIGEESFELNDTSASGASFFVPPEKMSEFQPGKILSKIILTLENEFFKIPKIEVIKEIPKKNKSNPNLKCVAVKFIDIFSTEETKLVVKLTTLIRKIALLRAPKK